MIFLFWLHSLCYAQENGAEKQAKNLFFNGQLLYEEGDYASAILAWEQGYELTQLPAFLKNIALAHEANKNYTEAIVYLKKYRAFAPFEEQEDLKVWLTELEANLKEQETIEALNITVPVVEESSTVEDTSSPEETVNIPNTNVSTESVSPPLPTKHFSIWGSATTGTLATIATISTIQTHRLYNDISNYCELTEGTGYCSTEVQENDLITQFNRSQTTSLVLWGASLAGVGLTVWQSTKPVQVHMTQRGFMIGGQF